MIDPRIISIEVKGQEAMTGQQIASSEARGYEEEPGPQIVHTF